MPRNATTKAGGARFYSWRNERYWSVTTIIGGGVPKPALLPWGIKSVAEGAVRKRDTLRVMLNDCQTPEACSEGHFCESCDQTVRWLKSVPYSKRDRAADLGTLVHTWIEAHRLGKPMPVCPPDVTPYLRAFELFLADFNPAYEATEATVYNRSQRYAGTLDAIVTLQLPLAAGPARFVLDAKSGKNVYAEVGLQLAAYRYAEFIGLPDGDEGPMLPVDGALALHLAPGRYRLIEVRADEQVFQSFLFAREVFRWQEETAKTVLGQEYANEVTQEVAA